LSVDVYKCRPRTAACSCNHYNPLVAWSVWVGTAPSP